MAPNVSSFHASHAFRRANTPLQHREELLRSDHLAFAPARANHYQQQLLHARHRVPVHRSVSTLISRRAAGIDRSSRSIEYRSSHIQVRDSRGAPARMLGGTAQSAPHSPSVLTQRSASPILRHAHAFTSPGGAAPPTPTRVPIATDSASPSTCVTRPDAARSCGRVPAVRAADACAPRARACAARPG